MNSKWNEILKFEVRLKGSAGYSQKRFHEKLTVKIKILKNATTFKCQNNLKNKNKKPRKLCPTLFGLGCLIVRVIRTI